jgi:hypothetical protein
VSRNLVANGGAELGPAVSDSGGIVARIPGWTRAGSFTVVKYGAPGGFPDLGVGKAVRGGKQFFAGGPANPGSSATQVVALSSLSHSIDTGTVRVTLSGYLGGFASQRDSLTVTATFLDGAGAKLGSIQLGPVTAAQRKNATTLLPQSKQLVLPRRTRSVSLALRAVRTDGSYNDGYADNIALSLSGTPGAG